MSEYECECKHARGCACECACECLCACHAGMFSIINTIIYLHILYGNNFAHFVTNDTTNLPKETAQKYLGAKIKSKKKKILCDQYQLKDWREKCKQTDRYSFFTHQQRQQHMQIRTNHSPTNLKEK